MQKALSFIEKEFQNVCDTARKKSNGNAKVFNEIRKVKNLKRIA